ncbi:histidine kinase N-terminal 7TM domain-containing protein [Anaeromyxobacter paludicola]|uniref:PAS/PAC sensor protein n=1 Tax=Anaeromyxobacter paludicola TaxID=2918171 RepID=A0ABM7XA40_9BACT|nr:histidine kinase N-terminal 7TM domain-containing protein [Anaeromyxobacter paludicola]BDG08708.1 hypothetical protein AMPC_18210 [Anaeromyxobacter paludicola]
MPGFALAATALYLSAAALCAGAGMAAWRRRETRGARSLALLLAAAGWWALFDALGVLATGPRLNLLCAQLLYLGVAPAAPLFSRTALELTREERWLAPRLRAAGWVVPLLTVAVAFTNPLHHLLWARVVPAPAGGGIALYYYGPWFWLFIAGNYAHMAIGTAALLRAAGRAVPGLRGPLAVVAVSAVLPWAGSAVYIAKLGPWPGIDWTALGVAAMGALLAWAVLRQGLLDLVPIAQEAVVESLGDGVLLVDRGGRLLLRNPAAQGALGLGPEATSGEVAALARSWERERAPGERWQEELALGEGDGRRWLEVAASPVRTAFGEEAGRLYLVRDVTGRRRAREERERLIRELEDAVGEVRRLQALLPICSCCHQVRDDQGYWRKIEAYFQQRTAVQFTHGVCPACLARLYPGVKPPPEDTGEA